ncbi:MAG: DUF2510 domain-containing protein [Beutenbergiaceae bacterium]
MTTKEAGWYPDPNGDNQQRYWDGEAWTDYRKPLAEKSQQLHGALTASQDYPYLAQARPDHYPMPVDGPGWSAAGPQPTNGQFSGGQRRSTALWWVGVVVVLVVVAVVAALMWRVLGPPAPPTASDQTAGVATPDLTPMDPVSLSTDSSENYEVDSNAIWIGELNITSPATVLVDVRSETADTDLSLSVVDDQGNEIYGNDDRGPQLAAIGGEGLDPLAFMALDPGNLTLRIHELDGKTTDFQLQIDVIDDEVSLGRQSISVPQSSGWVGFLTITNAQEYEVEVSSSGQQDPVLILRSPSNRVLISDDIDTDNIDSRLVEELEVGTWMVLVHDYDGDSARFDLSVDTP